ncbi:hypothetical protein [Acetobacter persici]|uniref:hypothetical protein n=1 Tax=Acetobacter persici TaxID=1076596 RepID=UPI0039ED7286
MQDFDAQKGLEKLSRVVGQALALLTVDNPGKQAALDRLLIHHEAIAQNPSASLVMDKLRQGAEPMFSQLRTGELRQADHPFPRSPED